MSQHWQVIAPARKETTGILGDLIDALLTGSAAGLVPLLAVPLNAHREHIDGLLPGENAEDNQDDDFECTTRTRCNGLSQNHSSKAARIEHHNATEVSLTSPKSLFNFPSEIHHRIFSLLDVVEDVLRFSLTNRYFWAVGLAHIEEHIIASLAPWAGEKIICVSDKSDPHDFPPNLLTPTEAEEVKELNKLYDFNSFSIRNTYKKIGGPPLSQKLQIWFLDYEAGHYMGTANRAEIMMGLKPEILEFYPRDQRWILRNLTTREYVRGEVIALKEEFIHGPQIEVFGFAEVLISRISWSTQPEKIGGGNNITRGKWAGHRFDITPLAWLQEKHGKEPWRDVSNEILREIDLILGGRMGDDWRDQMARNYRKHAKQALVEYS
ncbi:uncharacterized protein N7496_005381 [Penicillium cataractarum]|uniref:F-box domain-containing protein n=1 Tax=Penicillium cataractarum TaxID=2100454 RepID=A0A9W9SH16_9EURO|nr:uncharacterized protein N7496_005381 [Penicillium cataractarum]KAJ5377972.1 hypothetical protein N7496_005381 [Penicillium cataractarum]